MYWVLVSVKESPVFVCSDTCYYTLTQKHEFLLTPVGCVRVGCHAGMNGGMIYQNALFSCYQKTCPTTPGVLMEGVTFAMATWEILLTVISLYKILK